MELFETQDEIERRIATVRAQLEVLEEDVDPDRAMARLRMAHPFHAILVLRRAFMWLTATALILALALGALPFASPELYRIYIAPFQTGIGLPLPLVVGVIGVSILIAWATASQAASRPRTQLSAAFLGKEGTRTALCRAVQPHPATTDGRPWRGAHLCRGTSEHGHSRTSDSCLSPGVTRSESPSPGQTTAAPSIPRCSAPRHRRSVPRHPLRPVRRRPTAPQILLPRAPMVLRRRHPIVGRRQHPFAGPRVPTSKTIPPRPHLRSNESSPWRRRALSRTPRGAPGSRTPWARRPSSATTFPVQARLTYNADAGTPLHAHPRASHPRDGHSHHDGLRRVPPRASPHLPEGGSSSSASRTSSAASTATSALRWSPISTTKPR